jgi:hypothetical protein
VSADRTVEPNKEVAAFITWFRVEDFKIAAWGLSHNSWKIADGHHHFISKGAA